MSQARIDQKDHVILHALKKDARKTIADLSHELGIPRATVHERIMKLKQSGVIKRFTIEQDYSLIGLPTMGFVFASYDMNAKVDQHQLARNISNIGGVYGVYVISGEWDLLIKVRGKSIEDIGTLIVDKIRKTPGIAKTHSIACFEVVLDEI